VAGRCTPPRPACGYASSTSFEQPTVVFQNDSKLGWIRNFAIWCHFTKFCDILYPSWNVPTIDIWLLKRIHEISCIHFPKFHQLSHTFALFRDIVQNFAKIHYHANAKLYYAIYKILLISLIKSM
jgi:hypothetical protein